MPTSLKRTLHPKRLSKSFSYACEGLVYIIKNHHNARIIFMCALCAVVLGAKLGISSLEMLVVVLAIGIVFVSEIFNTMLEDITNLITDKQFHPAVKVIKDMAAAAVLVASLISLSVGYFVFFKRLMELWK
jgi:diacylglycerol kinase